MTSGTTVTTSNPHPGVGRVLDLSLLRIPSPPGRPVPIDLPFLLNHPSSATLIPIDLPFLLYGPPSAAPIPIDLPFPGIRHPPAPSVPIDQPLQAIRSLAMPTCVTGKSYQTCLLVQRFWRNCQIVRVMGSRFREEIASVHNAERRDPWFSKDIGVLDWQPKSPNLASIEDI
jgi:hypothetical protein